MKLKKQILITFGSFTVIIMLAIFFLNYFVIKSSIEKQAFQEVEYIVDTAYNATINLLDHSIKSYLRAISDQNKKIMYFYYNQYLKGKISKKQAHFQIKKLLLNQKIGKSGYMVAVKKRENKELYIVVHPYFKNQPCDENLGIKPCRLWKNKNTFISYYWKNPKENALREKVAYINYFEPFKWFFGASSYKDEFKSLLKIEDVKNFLQHIKIKNSGYIVVFDGEANYLIHPELEGKNAKKLKSAHEYNTMKRVFKQKNGIFIYDWKNKDSKKMRKKYAYIRYIKNFDWYLVATGYLSDVLAPVHNVLWVSFLFILSIGILMSFVVYEFEKSITKPIQKILSDIESFQKEKLGFDLPRFIPKNISEIRLLARSFNQMSKEINNYTTLLEANLKDLELSKNQNEKLKLYLKNLLDSLPSLIIGIDLEGNINSLNKAAQSLTHRFEQEILGKNATEVFPFFKSFFPTLLKAVQNKKQYEKSKVSYLNSKQEKKVFLLNAYPVYNQEKGAVIRLDDITKLLKLQEMIIHNEKMLSLSGLAAGMAHEINNPLGAILQGLQNMRRRTDTHLAKNQEAARKLDFSLDKMTAYFEDRNIFNYLNGAEDAAKRAAFIVENMLNFTRKGNNIKKHPNLNLIIDKSIQLALNDYKMGKDYDIKKIEIIKNYDLNLPPLDCIETELEQVFFNLIINCAQALWDLPDNAHPKIEIKSSFDAQSKKIKVSIQDNGPGIAEKNKKNIFNPFFTTKEVGKGTGLGLAVVYFIINDHHQGSINVFSSKGAGAKFMIELPLSIS